MVVVGSSTDSNGVVIRKQVQAVQFGYVAVSVVADGGGGLYGSIHRLF
jgi:hypothetical protein